MIWDKSGTNVYFSKTLNSIKALINMVIAPRLERGTYCLEGIFLYQNDKAVSYYFHSTITLFHRVGAGFMSPVVSREIRFDQHVSGTNLGQIEKINFESRNSNKNIIAIFLKNIKSISFNFFGGPECPI